MRKLTLLATATLITLACIGSQSISAEAAGARYQSLFKCGNKVIFVGKFNCLPGIQLPESCLPEINIPDNNCPGSPEVETPDNNIPNIPETETPDNKPDTEIPGQEQLSFAEQVVELVNAERAKEGLASLTIDKKVQAAAQVRAVEIKTSFSHTRPNGSSFATALKEQGVTYRRSGENIAWGQRTPQEVVNAWMNSSGHRANIMNENFTKIGVGYYQHNGVNYWSQLFIG